MIDFIYPLGLRIRAEKKIDNFYLLYVWEDGPGHTAAMLRAVVLTPPSPGAGPRRRRG